MDIKTKKKQAKKRARRARARRANSMRVKLRQRERVLALRRVTKILATQDLQRVVNPFNDFLVMLYFMLMFFNKEKSHDV